MSFLPIVERELRVVSRRRAMYWNRVIVAGLIAGVAVVMLLFGALTGAASQVGGVMFDTLAFLMLVFCLLEGARKTADCLSEEKREGTLGLLFLTDLRGYDVVLGKLAAKSVSSYYGLLSILPLLAMSLLLGGVTAGEYWRMALALVNILFASLCVGLWVSAWSRTTQQSMGRALLVMAVWVVAPLFVPAGWLQALSPVHAYEAAFAMNYRGHGGGYWRSLAFGQAVSWLLLAWSAYLTPRSFQEKAVTVSTARWGGRSRARMNAGVRARMLERNPAFWLAVRDARQRVMLGICIGIALLGTATLVLFHDRGMMPLYFGGAALLNFVLKMRLAAQAGHCLAEARQSKALEMMLSTPLTVDQIISGQVDALKRIFGRPMLAVLGLEFLGVVIMLVATKADEQTITATLLAALFYLVIYLLEIAAVTWTGMWFGLTSKGEGQAITKTIFFILILPWLLVPCWPVGLVFWFISPIVWIAIAGDKLRQELRRVAAVGYGGTLADVRGIGRPGIGGGLAPLAPPGAGADGIAR